MISMEQKTNRLPFSSFFTLKLQAAAFTKSKESSMTAFKKLSDFM